MPMSMNFNENEKLLDLEKMLDKAQDEIADLRAENNELKLRLELEPLLKETDKGNIDFTTGEIIREEPHILEEYKAATARMNEYFKAQCDKLDAQG